MRSGSNVTVVVALAATSLAATYPAGAADAPHCTAQDQSAPAPVPTPPPAAGATRNHAPPKTTASDKELAKARAERCRIHPGTCVQQADSAKP